MRAMWISPSLQIHPEQEWVPDSEKTIHWLANDLWQFGMKVQLGPITHCLKAYLFIYLFFEEEIYGSPLNLLIGKLKEQEN